MWPRRSALPGRLVVPLSNRGNTIDAARDGTVVCLQCAEPFLHFAHVLAQAIDRAANVAKVFKHQLVFRGFGRDALNHPVPMIKNGLFG
jgi:hypothetical protein